MNKIISLIIIVIFLNNCSFGNKSGIWTGSDQIVKNQNSDNQNLELIFKKQSNLIKAVELSPGRLLSFDNPKLYKDWPQSFQNKFNNINNVSFLNEGNYKKLSKISNAEVNRNILVYQNNLFFSDFKGNIGIFSLSENSLIFKFNFYKKKIKKTKKNIKMIILDNNIIAADNFGYIYSVNYKTNKIEWAKNFLIPFRSNLKIINGIIFISDEKNKVILIDSKNGNKIEELYTQPAKTVSKFENNLAVDSNNNILFLSTNGTLYSLNLLNNKIINWIQNFKSENDLIFNGNPIVVSNKNIIISTSDNITLLNENGSRIWNLNIKSSILPVISGNTIFTINDDNYLMLINKRTGEIIYSKNLHLLIASEFKKDFQKKIKKIDHIYLINNKLLLISSKSYFVEINIGNIININSIKKNPFNILSDVIFLENEMLFVSRSNKIYKVN